MSSRPAAERREELVKLFHQLKDCRECPLADSRTNVVFGMGNPDADLMFVGEAPGFHEDQQGLPFVGRAGQLLDRLLGDIGLERRRDAFVANVLKCLRYNVPVQLGDGSWERIGRLVRSRYSGTVMSVDEDGRLAPRRVTGWYATPVAERHVYRLTYRSAQRSGAGRVGIELTGDHPVLTERGYVRVDQLAPWDRIATGQGLSQLAFDVVCGTVLGDGTLQRASAHLSMSHSIHQAEYARFKAGLLAELRPVVSEHVVAAVAGGPRDHTAVHVRTRAHRALRPLRRDFYADRKRVPEWLRDRLNPRMLAVWFMDDGHMRLRTGRSPRAEIAAYGFSEKDLKTLQIALFRMGLPVKRAGGRLYFDVVTTEILSEVIAPFVPPPMRYKLHPDVEAQVPFDPSSMTPEPTPQVLYDEIDVEDITDQPRPDTTFFCIDVEDTHNFVTSGGVVHNCRPPGNRDPRPEEIEECKPHLMRQIELIEPMIICTLGNFATKLLSGSQQGITKVHGRVQQREIAGLDVKLYPLFHPAAALRTPAVLAMLEQDFAAIPGLLAEVRPEPVAAGAAAADQLDLFASG